MTELPNVEVIKTITKEAQERIEQKRRAEEKETRDRRLAAGLRVTAERIEEAAKKGLAEISFSISREAVQVTNGKASLRTGFEHEDIMLESALRTAGYCTSLYAQFDDDGDMYHVNLVVNW